MSFQHAALRAKLWPLIHRRLEIGRIEIRGLDVRLQKNAEGRGNWEGFGRSEEQPSTVSADSREPLERLAAIRITHSSVSYQKFTVNHVDLETAPFADGVIPIAVHFDASRGVATEHATVDAKVDFARSGARRFRLAAMTLIGRVKLAGDKRALRWNMSTPKLDVDLDAQTFAAPVFALTVAGAQLNGDLNGTKIIDDPSVAGAVTLVPLVVREFIPRWGLTAPQTQDPKAFSQVAGSFAFSYGGQELRFDNVDMALDDTHIRGNVAVENLETQALKFNVSADQIDLDRYLTPEGQPSAPVKPAVKSSEPPRPLELHGNLAIGSLHLSRLDLSNLRLTVAAKNGLMHIFPLQAQVDGGPSSGDITLDSRGSMPLVSVDEHLSGADMGKLLANSDGNIRLSGKGGLSVKASGRGATTEAVLKTLNGHVEAYVTAGAVEGIDLGYELGRAEALIRRDKGPSIQNTNRTEFDAFKASAEIVNGIARTKDLTISSNVLRVTGQGSANLVSKAIDFELLADTLKTVQGVPIQIPIKVTGTTSSSAIRPDIKAWAESQLRQKLQDVVHGKLQGLFGKP